MSDTTDRMQELCRIIEVHLPPDTGFVLLAFDRGDHKPGVVYKMEYASNGIREDVVRAMKEFISKTENTWGKHV